MLRFFQDPIQVSVLVRMVAVLGMLISTLELLAAHRSYRPKGLACWQVLRSRRELIRKPWLGALADFFLAYPNFLVLLVLRGALLLVLLLPILPPPLLSICLFLLLVSTLLVNYRSAFGQDGSDQMNSVVVTALFLGSLGGHLGPVSGMEIALWFIALQACLSYLAAGVIKVKGEKWRRGSAVADIFGTRSYGQPALGRWLHQHPRVSKLLTWQVVVVEVAFPLVLIVSFPWAWAFLLWGLLFHLMNAFVMGLNSFLPAFVSTYFAIVYVNLQILS